MSGAFARMNKHRWTFAALLLIALGASIITTGRIAAQPKYGPEDLKSVPKSFLEGGDRSAALLDQILTVLKEEQSDQQDLRKSVQNIELKLDLLLKKLDSP